MSAESQTEAVETVPQNPAVERCLLAWQDALENAMSQEGTSRGKALGEANDAFRQTMPPIDSEENIRDFVACVGYGLLNGIFSSTDAPRLLYAAQVAISATRNAKTAQKPAA